jgi:hypothetical protein
MMISETSHVLAHQLANVQLRICRDAGDGFLDHYPEQFADDVTAVLNEGWEAAP